MSLVSVLTRFVNDEAYARLVNAIDSVRNYLKEHRNFREHEPHEDGCPKRGVSHGRRIIRFS